MAIDTHPAHARWVATPPPGGKAPARHPARGQYRGPPAYPAPPRWGFPQLAWRRPTLVPGTLTQPPRPRERLRAAAVTAVGMLALTAAAAATATGAEIWRYVLLVMSRDRLLTQGTVEVSDTLTDTAGVLELVFAIVAAGLALVWLYRARVVARETTGRRPARGDWQALAGPFVPGPNLVLPFSVLAELEHAALGNPPGERPCPGRLVLAWGVAWVVNAVLFLVVLLWTLRGSIQALADGVLLHAVLDGTALVLAVLTMLVVLRLSRLLVPRPAEQIPYRYVLRVTGDAGSLSGTSSPRRRERPAHAAR